MDWLSYILAVKNAVKPTDDQVSAAVTAHLTAHPVTPGASEEEAAQIAQNKDDIAELQDGKLDNSGWAANKYLGTDADGNVVEKEAPSGDGAVTDEQIAQAVEEYMAEHGSESSQNKTVEKECAAELSITGFTRPNGTFSTSASGLRTDYVSTDGVTKIYGNAGFYSSAAVMAFYDANKTCLESLGVIGSSLTAEGSGYGEGAFELDISGDAYADAAYFVVSTYRLASGVDYTQTVADDYCKYIKLIEVTEEARTAYRISENTITFFGDSVTSGAGDGDYPSLIAEITGATVTNNGVSGSTLASGTTSTHHICEDVAAYTGTADIICVSGGLNDYNQNVPIGTLTDGYAAELDTATVIGALESIVRSLLTNHTEAKIYYVITHMAASAEVNTNTLGLTLGDYHDAIVSVLRKYSIPYYDAFAQSGLVTSSYGSWGETIRSLYTVDSDGVHPNREGYLKYYVYQIIDMMESGVGSGSAEIPEAVTDEHINELIDAKLGVIENGTY